MSRPDTATQDLLQQLRFEKADFFVSNNAQFNSRLTVQQRVALYAHRQQALVGPCNTPKPSMLELVEEVKLRWRAWHGLGDMSHAEAARHFVRLVAAADTRWGEWAGFPEPAADELTEETLIEATVLIQAQLRRHQAQAVQLMQTRAARTLQRAARSCLGRAAASSSSSGSGAGSELGVGADAGPATGDSPRVTNLCMPAADEVLEKFWQMLIAGIVVTKWGQGNAKPAKRTLWLGLGGARLFVASRKASTPVADSKGLLLRDISEVRVGHACATFKKALARGVELPPEACCLCLIGTERTIDISVDDAAVAQGLAKRLDMLLARVNASSALAENHRWGRLGMDFEEVATLARFTEVMMQGIEVFAHLAGGNRSKRILWLARKRVFIARTKNFDPTASDSGVDVDDIAEIRPGMNSHAFCTHDSKTIPIGCCFSIVGSERTIDVEVLSSELRDELVRRFRLLIREHKRTRGPA